MDKRKPKNPAPNPPGSDQWRLDPSEVGFHARRMREANQVGPLGKLARIAAGALALAVAVWVYWNFDTLRELRMDFSGLTDLFADDAERDGQRSTRGGAPGTEVIEDTGIAGVRMPTSLDGEASEAPADAAVPPADGSPAPEPAAAAPGASPAPQAEPAPVARAEDEARAATPPPPRVPNPEPEGPITPETFHFGLSVVTVSEADASAAILVLREGGRRGVSSFTWWTTDGTATAGTDYARLDARVERFSVGEQNRAIHIPIIGDRNVEGPETFYVHVTAGENAAASGAAVERLEVVIIDDD